MRRRTLVAPFVPGANNGGPSGIYSVDFTALGSNETPINLGNAWTVSSQGFNGNAAMGTNTDMQIRLSADTTTRICCESDAAHSGYDDSIGWVSGFSGNQRIVGTVYKESGYSPPTTNHEIEMCAGAICNGADDKVCLQIGMSALGDWFLAIHDGHIGPWDGSSGWVVVYSAAVSNGVPANAEVITLELDRTAKTAKAWSGSTLRLSTDWNTTHDEIDSHWQTVLNNLGDGAGLAGIRRPGADAAVGKFGWRSFSVSPTVTGAP